MTTICAWCKEHRKDENGNWVANENAGMGPYSHGICPRCVEDIETAGGGTGAKVLGTCSHCGGHAEYMFGDVINATMKERWACYECNFWIDIIARRDDTNSIIAQTKDGLASYYIEGEQPTWKDNWKGFSGAKWTVKFFYGRTETTTNLSFQGVVPERFKHQLPENAILRREAK